MEPRRDIRRRHQRAQSGSIPHERARRCTTAHFCPSSSLGLLRPRRSSDNDHTCRQSRALDRTGRCPAIAAQHSVSAIRHSASGLSVAPSSPHPTTRGAQIPIAPLRATDERGPARGFLHWRFPDAGRLSTPTTARATGIRCAATIKVRERSHPDCRAIVRKPSHLQTFPRPLMVCTMRPYLTVNTGQSAS